MSKVKITEIKKVLKGKQKFEDLTIEVKKFIPFEIKDNVVNVVLSGCKIERDGILTIDYLAKQMYTEMALTKRYTNIDFSTVDKVEDVGEWIEKYFNYYDILSETGIIDYVIDNIPQRELDRVLSVIDKEVEQLQQVSTSVYMAIDNGVSKIKEELGKITESMPKNAEDLQKMLGTLKGFGLGDE